jgi:hypothetical protein
MSAPVRQSSGSREQEFSAWLDDDFSFRVAVKYEHGQWYALLLEFDITGCGATRGAAVQDSFELLGSYLQAYFEEGAPFADTLRPVPWLLRARITVESMIGRPLRGLALRFPLASESTYTLPPGLLRFAH